MNTQSYRQQLLARFLSPLVVALALSACGGSEGTEEPNIQKPLVDDPQASPVCDSLDGAVFATKQLFSERHAKHGFLRFGASSVALERGDESTNADYRCDSGQYVVSLSAGDEQTLILNAQKTSFTFSPEGGSGPSYTYERIAEINTTDACERVSGNRYDAATGAVRILDFYSEDRVRHQDGDAISVAYFDCQLGELHLHSAPEDVEPSVLELSEKSSDISTDYIDVVKDDGLEGFRYLYVEPLVCTAQYDPVCAAKQTGIVCVTTPCPTEEYATYSNACEASVAGSRYLFQGECGALEGKPVEEGVPCEHSQAAVCGAVTRIAPCLSLPCPSLEYKTFSNQCELEEAGAEMLAKGRCAESDGTLVQELPERLCTKEYMPVCAKDKSNIQCVTTPCPSHSYSTYGNACEASAALAYTAYLGQCEKLEEVLSFERPPVKVVASDDFPAFSDATIHEASIEGDVLKLVLISNGCSEQHFDMWIGSEFMESNPVQASIAFTAQEVQPCYALIYSEHEYDLLPLKVHYQAAYQSETGVIILPGVRYQF